VFDVLPKSDWFAQPYDEMLEISICKNSGYRASSICDATELRYIQKSGQKTEPCPYHKLLHLDVSERYQVNSSCEAVSNINTKAWFILPPLQAYYFKTKNPFYKMAPPFRTDCVSLSGVSMEFIYPNQQSTIFLPKDFDGNTNDLILKVAHSKPALELYWYIDNQFVGSTKDIHDMAILPASGKHIITVVDELGNELKHHITILE
jgi:penicillin-binding protein 1C